MTVKVTTKQIAAAVRIMRASVANTFERRRNGDVVRVTMIFDVPADQMQTDDFNADVEVAELDKKNREMLPGDIPLESVFDPPSRDTPEQMALIAKMNQANDKQLNDVFRDIGIVSERRLLKRSTHCRKCGAALIELQCVQCELSDVLASAGTEEDLFSL